MATKLVVQTVTGSVEPAAKDCGDGHLPLVCPDHAEHRHAIVCLYIQAAARLHLIAL